MITVHHFYHVWAAGCWPEPVGEHIEALNTSGFEGRLTVGLVGAPRDRAAARSRIVERLRTSTQVDWIESDSGFEQVTLAGLRDWSHRNDGLVLYTHTKGARDPSDWNARWRRSMTAHLVGDWRRCVELLASGYDAVGCHYLPPTDTTGGHFFGGNFWWATTDYLRRLPAIGHRNRHDAEAWVGLADPTVYDPRPGWPAEELFAND